MKFRSQAEWTAFQKKSKQLTKHSRPTSQTGLDAHLQ